MVTTSQLLSDSTLHQSREGGEDAAREREKSANERRERGKKREDALDRRVDLLVVQLTVDRDLTLRDVTRQIGNRVGDVCAKVSNADDQYL